MVKALSGGSSQTSSQSCRLVLAEPLTSRTSEHVFSSCQDSTARLPW